MEGITHLIDFAGLEDVYGPGGQVGARKVRFVLCNFDEEVRSNHRATDPGLDTTIRGDRPGSVAVSPISSVWPAPSVMSPNRMAESTNSTPSRGAFRFLPKHRDNSDAAVMLSFVVPTWLCPAGQRTTASGRADSARRRANEDRLVGVVRDRLVPGWRIVQLRKDFSRDPRGIEVLCRPRFECQEGDGLRSHDCRGVRGIVA